MSNPVNMKYKLKIDNIYIRGDKENYVDIDELDVEDIILLENSNTLFTLEWCWVDSDEEDTYVGSLKSDEYYTLNVLIHATAY